MEKYKESETIRTTKKLEWGAAACCETCVHRMFYRGGHRCDLIYPTPKYIFSDQGIECTKHSEY